MSVGPDAIAGIQDAAHVAFVAAFDGFPLSEEVDSEAAQETLADYTNRAHAAAHEAVRTASAEFGVEPGDYYRADPGSASSCEPECAQKWPEVPVDVINQDPVGDYLAWFEAERILTVEAETARAENRQVEETGSGATLGEDVIREIATSGQHVADTVREDFVRPHRTHPAQDEMADGGVLARHQAWHRGVQDKSDELGVDRSAYFRAVSDSTADCNVRCLDDWPELRDAVYVRAGDAHFSRLDDEVGEALAAQDVAHEMAILRQQQLDDLDLDDLTGLYDGLDALDEEPPADDLGSGAGVGY